MIGNLNLLCLLRIAISRRIQVPEDPILDDGSLQSQLPVESDGQVEEDIIQFTIEYDTEEDYETESDEESISSNPSSGNMQRSQSCDSFFRRDEAATDCQECIDLACFRYFQGMDVIRGLVREMLLAPTKDAMERMAFRLYSHGLDWLAVVDYSDPIRIVNDLVDVMAKEKYYGMARMTDEAVDEALQFMKSHHH